MSLDTKYLKDPDAVLDYMFDWSDWLASGETIISHTITAETGIVVDSSTESAGKVTVWLFGGTARTDYRVSCLITTSAGRTDERSIMIQVEDR